MTLELGKLKIEKPKELKIEMYVNMLSLMYLLYMYVYSIVIVESN